MSTSPACVSDAQILEWKKRYKEVYCISVENKKGYFRVPSRDIISYAMLKAEHNPLGYYEAIAQNTWLGGDENMLENDACFFAICTQLSELVKVKEATLKKC